MVNLLIILIFLMSINSYRTVICIIMFTHNGVLIKFQNPRKFAVSKLSYYRHGRLQHIYHVEY